MNTSLKILIIMGIIIIGINLSVVGIFGTFQPIAVAISGSMEPVIYTNDVAVINAYVKFSELKVGDIISFDPPYHDKNIIHRIVEINNPAPMNGLQCIKCTTLRTMGDANGYSIENIDYPITQDQYIGKVVYIIPKIGVLMNIFFPPYNFIAIGILITSSIIIKRRQRHKEIRHD